MRFFTFQINKDIHNTIIIIKVAGKQKNGQLPKSSVGLLKSSVGVCTGIPFKRS